MPSVGATHRFQADFSGLFGDILCLSHDAFCRDESGNPIVLRSGMAAMAFEEDMDERGQREYLVAEGIVEPSPDWLNCRGSKWVLRIDSRGVRHESDIGTSA